MSAMSQPHVVCKVLSAMLLLASAWAQTPGSPVRAGVARDGVEAPGSPVRDGVEAPSSAQAIRSAVREYRLQHEVEIVRGYAELLSLPNVASDTANIQANAGRIEALLQQRGFQTRLLSVPGSPPVVYGELPAPGAKHTILWYAHYDGQPVDPLQCASRPSVPV